eukprot:763782-Hanusia_phi.AAC.2
MEMMMMEMMVTMIHRTFMNQKANALTDFNSTPVQEGEKGKAEVKCGEKECNEEQEKQFCSECLCQVVPDYVDVDASGFASNFLPGNNQVRSGEVGRTGSRAGAGAGAGEGEGGKEGASRRM